MTARTSKQASKHIDGKGSTTPTSGAYIRSLVTQLTTSTTTLNDKDREGMRSRDREARYDVAQQQSGPPTHKKQLRRRLHTTRPYQERLLNMAEARREIVAALKYHRATMKQSKQQQQEMHLNHHHSPPPLPNPLHQPPRYLNNHFDTNSTPLLSFPCAHNRSLSMNQNPFLVQLPSSVDSVPVLLPNQTLGLNLNLQDFDNIYHDGITTTSPSIYPTSSSSSSSSVVSIISHEVGQGLAKATTEAVMAKGEEIAEVMRSIGERHQMEWNDKMNLVTSAWWFEFLKGMESGDEDPVKRVAGECYDEGNEFQIIFDEVMEFPPWLGGGEGCLEQHMADDCFSHDYFLQDASSLDCMDIGEIEGLDGDWFS